MTIPPLDPSAVAGLGSEWQIPGIGGVSPAETNVPGVAAPFDASSGGFGSVLSEQIGRLSELQESASAASQALANGTATDASSVVVAVEKAQLAMQLAGTIRTKGAEAVNDIFHTQI